MPRISTGLDDETYSRLIADAQRHLRPTDRHIAALLRLALGLSVPLPRSEEWPREGSEAQAAKGQAGLQEQAQRVSM